MLHLKELRAKKGITQTDLAKSLGISASAIGMYEQGRREPDSDTLIAIANYFQVTTDYLLGKSDTPEYRFEKIAAVPENAEPINKLVDELFADRPDVLALLTNGVYDDEGIYAGKKLSDLSEPAKKHLKDTIISVLEMSGYLKPNTT